MIKNKNIFLIIFFVASFLFTFAFLIIPLSKSKKELQAQEICLGVHKYLNSYKIKNPKKLSIDDKSFLKTLDMYYTTNKQIIQKYCPDINKKVIHLLNLKSYINYKKKENENYDNTIYF